jgi:acyl-CoA synthetase (AMP-forming)/AMP-acid ligase II
MCVDKIAPEQMAGLDLSCWRNALNGSEPVRAATLDRFARAFAPCGFRREAMFPCYGLAEATLFVTGPRDHRSLTRRRADGTIAPEIETNVHVGCGRTFGDARLLIVDPATSTPVAPGAVGEIWVAGESVATGYWKNAEATAKTFGASLAGSADHDANLRGTGFQPVSAFSTDHGNTGGKPAPLNGEAWLRTGDLGFVADGELFITGRLRELIVIAGRNHFPVDIERTVEAADPAIATTGAVAFSADVNGVERLIIAAEIRRELSKSVRASAPAEASRSSSSATAEPTLDLDAIARRIRAAVAAEHEVAPRDVVLLKPGALPRTTSGKLSRRAARDAYLQHSLETFSESHVYARH